MCFKAIKYSVKFKKYGTTCLRPLIVFLVTYVGYIFFNNPDTSFVPITACAIFTLYLELLFILVKPIIQQVPAVCFKAFKYSVKFKKFAATCLRLLMEFSVIFLTYTFLKNADAQFVLMTVHAIVIFSLLLYLFIPAGMMKEQAKKFI